MRKSSTEFIVQYSGETALCSDKPQMDTNGIWSYSIWRIEIDFAQKFRRCFNPPTPWTCITVPVGGLSTCDSRKNVSLQSSHLVSQIHQTSTTKISKYMSKPTWSTPIYGRSSSHFLMSERRPAPCQAVRARKRSPPGRRGCLTTTCSSGRPWDTSAECPWCFRAFCSQKSSSWNHWKSPRGEPFA